jgi:photosystem II stability/assembly factor-like uncharacterized protein
MTLANFSEAKMKHIHHSLVLLIMIVAAGCTPAAEAPAAPWEIMREIKVEHSTIVAGFLNDSFGLTAGPAGEVHYTTDGGQTWPQAENQSLCRFGLDIVNEKLAWNVGNGGQVRVSTDGGQTWQAVTTLMWAGNFISFIDAQTGWATSRRSTLWATNDGGQTWTEVTLPEGIGKFVGVSRGTANDGYLMDNSGLLYITHNGGQTWTTESLGPTDLPLMDIAHGAAIRFFNTDHGIIVACLAGDGQSKVVAMKTIDGGKTWETEELPVKIGALFLSHDGTTLTVMRDNREMIVLGNPGAPESLSANDR